MALSLAEQKRMADLERQIAAREGRELHEDTTSTLGSNLKPLSPEEESRKKYLEETLAKRGAFEQQAEPHREGAGSGFYNFTKRLEQSPVTQTALGLGETMQDIMRAPVEFAYDVPRRIGSAISGDEFVPTKGSDSLAYDASRLGSEIASYFIAPQATIAARIAQAGGISAALNPEDPVKSGLTGAAWGAFGETIPFLGRLAEKGVDKFTRANYTDDMVKSIQKMFEKEKIEAWSPVKPLFDELGDKRISSKARDYLASSTEGIRNSLKGGTAGVKKYYDDILKNKDKVPTLEELQKLQSKIGSNIRQIEKTASPEIISEMEDARSLIQNIIKGNFDFYKPGSSGIYQEAMQSYARGPGKYLRSDKMAGIAEGTKYGVTPKYLESALGEATTGAKAAAPGHYLSQISPEVTEKIARSPIYKGIAGAIPGAILGSAGGPLGAIGGAAAGAIVPTGLSALTGQSGAAAQKEIARFLQKYYPMFEEISRPAVLGAASQLGREE